MQRGESFRTTTIKLQKRIGQEAYKSERLVRTEIITASNEAKKEYMNDFDNRCDELDMDLLKAMKVLETLDNRTCKNAKRWMPKSFLLKKRRAFQL